MNLLESIGYENIKSRALLWWESKSKDEKIEIETYVAIAAPQIGSMLGMLVVLLIP